MSLLVVIVVAATTGLWELRGSRPSEGNRAGWLLRRTDRDHRGDVRRRLDRWYPQIDVIAGLAGNDMLYEQDGNDIICGNEGATASSVAWAPIVSTLRPGSGGPSSSTGSHPSGALSTTESGTDVWFEI